MSDTPRTDATYNYPDLVDLARQLERELAAARKSAELAWLIEIPDARWGTGYFWCGPDAHKYSAGNWGTIEFAVRFSRKEDAERIIAGLRLRTNVSLEACEHEWPAIDAALAPSKQENCSES